ncbi:MAG: hypothetical protein JSS29_16790 [Proteobacteria bacterium]|nr:hypothetical protein [Pseudomonadota bacterium]
MSAEPVDTTRYEAVQGEMRTCAYCHSMFTPKRRWEAFCKSRCRMAYEADFGAQGKVASVRRLKNGVSVVVHLEGPAAERAVKLGLRELVRITRKP